MEYASEAYRQGWRAWADGLTLSSNPYQPKTDDWLDWISGFDAAKMFEVHR